MTQNEYKLAMTALLGFMIIMITSILTCDPIGCEHKWNEKDIYSTNKLICSKCGEQRCIHKYEIIDTLFSRSKNKYTYETFISSKTFILKCVNCGEIKEKKINN